MRDLIEGKKIEEDLEKAVAATKFKLDRDMKMYRKLNMIKFTTSE